jgi:hypothetical protein
MAEIPSQNQKNRAEVIFSAKFPSWNFKSEKRNRFYKYCLWFQDLIFLHVHVKIYREDFNCVDPFIVMCFLVTGAPLASRYIKTVLMNRYA